MTVEAKRKLTVNVATGAILACMLAIPVMAHRATVHAQASQPMARAAMPKAPAAGAAAAMPTSTPASQPGRMAVNPEDPVSIFNALYEAFGKRNWPVVVMLVATLLMFLESRFKGVLGVKSSAWLTSTKGMVVVSIIHGVITAGLAAAYGGWGVLWKGCLIALVLGLLNYAALNARPYQQPTA